MKIALCTNHFHPSVGGCESVTETIARYLSQFHEVSLFTRFVQQRERIKFLPVQIVDYQPANAAAFMRGLQALDPDIIFIYSDVFDYFRELVLSPFKLRAKIVVGTCGANWLHDNPSLALTFCRNYSRLHAIVCHSEHNRDYKLCFCKNLCQKTHIIPNGVYLSEFDQLLSKTELCQKYALPTDKQWSVSVSNFLPGKGQEHALKIANNLDIAHIQISSDILFSAIGSVLEGKWKKINAGRHFLLKNVPHKDVLSILRASNILLFTSEKEVAPIVLLEAMAAELPWLATNVGNVESLRGGVVVRAPKNSQYQNIFNETVFSSLTVAAREVLSKPTLGKEGRKQVEDQFRWEDILPKYKFLIES